MSTRSKRIGKKFWSGLLVSLLLFAINLSFERTSNGEKFEHATYRFLQSLLGLTNGHKLPVVVVDISAIPRDKGTQATSRKDLLTLLESLTLPTYKVKAIGIDVDFSPENDGNYVTPDDPWFFGYCEYLKDKRMIPVYLGIWRSQHLPPDEWLGPSEFANIAASLTLPSKQDHKWATQWIESNDGRGRTLSWALATAYDKEKSGASVPRGWSWLLDRSQSVKISGSEDLTARQFAINYGQDKLLRARMVRVSVSALQSKEKLLALLDGWQMELRDKVVLLGDSQEESRPNSDVFAHASAIYTLVSAPLYIFREPWRICADLVLAFFTLGVNTVFLLSFSTRSWRKHGPLKFLIYLLPILVVVFVGAGVNYHRVLWDDFLVVAIVLAIHPMIAYPVERAWK